jgi:hypothetical protein
MLFSSGDSPRNLSSILSGEGLDEVERGESSFVLSAVCKICSLTFGLALLKQPGD